MTSTNTTNQQSMAMVGNVSVTDPAPYPLPEARRDPLAPAAWPKIIGSLSLLMGVLGICFVPPPEAMAVVAPQSQGAAHLFPDAYRFYGIAVLAGAILLHISLALCGIAALRYSWRLRGYYIAYALGYVAYVFGAVFAMINTMSETDLSPLSQARRISILEAERTFYYVMSGSLIWPAFLLCLFLSPSIVGQIRAWGTTAFRQRLLERKHRASQG